MRPRLRRLVSIGLLLLQVAALAGLPAWRVHAAVPGPDADFCTTTPAERSAPAPQSPSPAHPTHACGDCCLAWGDAVPAPNVAARYPAPCSERAIDVHASTVSIPHAWILPPACGPPAHS